VSRAYPSGFSFSSQWDSQKVFQVPLKFSFYIPPQPRYLNLWNPSLSIANVQGTRLPYNGLLTTRFSSMRTGNLSPALPCIFLPLLFEINAPKNAEHPKSLIRILILQPLKKFEVFGQSSHQVAKKVSIQKLYYLAVVTSPSGQSPFHPG